MTKEKLIESGLSEELADKVFNDWNTEYKGLINKKDELLGKLHNKNEKLKSFEGIDVEKYNQYLEIEKQESIKQQIENTGSPNIKALLEETLTKNSRLENDLKLKQMEYEKITARAKKFEAENNKYIIDTVLTKNLKNAGVSPKHRDILMKAYRSDIVVEDGENGKQALIENNGVKIPVKDFFEQWKTTEIAKQYQDNVNSGGSAKGSVNSATNRTFTRAELQTPEKRAELRALLQKGEKPNIIE